MFILGFFLGVLISGGTGFGGISFSGKSQKNSAPSGMMFLIFQLRPKLTGFI